ncbi:MAG: type III pantothenate kinase [Ignavibacteriales bacterium]
MLLACDIGNTRQKFALFEGTSLVELRTFSGDTFELEWLKKYPVKNVAISSVVPSVTGKLTGMFLEELNVKPFVITHESLFNLKIDYATPHSLGIDRICSAEGAFSLFSREPSFKNYDKNTFLITVDLGTASTINIVKYNGIFDGGLIFPGISTMAGSLSKNTAQLPEIDLLNDYKNFIGKDTRSSIASGIINSTLSLIEKTCCYLLEQHKPGFLRVYLTGGNARIVHEMLSLEHQLAEDLVLQGVKAVFERNMIE